MIYLLGGYMWLFVHRPFEVWPAIGELHVERIYMLGTIAVWALRKKQWVSNRLHLAFGIFTAVMLLSWLFSPWPEAGRSVVEDYLKVGVFYVLLVSSVRCEEDLRKLLAMFLGAVGLYMLHSLWEFHNGRHVFTMDITRLIGVDHAYNDPNTFAATLIYSLPMSYPFWTEPPRSRLQRPLLVAYALLTIVCVLLTGSRTAMIGLVLLGGLTAIVCEPVRSHYKAFVVVAPLVAIVAWYLLPVELKHRYLTVVDPRYGPANAQESAESRSQGWRDGVRMWQQEPILGVGPAAFGKARGYNLESHHLYGQVLGETGTLGAIGLALIVWGFLRNAWDVHRLHKQWPTVEFDFVYHLVLAATAAAVLMLIMGFGGHNLYRYNWLWFGGFQLLALAAARSAVAWQLDEANQNADAESWDELEPDDSLISAAVQSS